LVAHHFLAANESPYVAIVTPQRFRSARFDEARAAVYRTRDVDRFRFPSLTIKHNIEGA
jgi:hypothetical protein